MNIDAYTGYLPMYLAAGFEEVRDAGRRTIVRRKLSPSCPEALGDVGQANSLGAGDLVVQLPDCDQMGSRSAGGSFAQ